MTTISFPSTPKPQTMSWRLVQPAQNNISTWTGKRQVVSSSRGWWECDLTLPPIVGTTNVNAWRSFLAKTQGAANDFEVPVDFVEQSPSVGVVTTNVADQTGRSISTTGWPTSTTNLVAGQYVTIYGQLHQLTADVTSNGSGVATLSVEPPVRTPVPNGTVVEYRFPYCLMYLVEKPAMSVEPGYVYSLSLSLRESF